MSGPCPSEQNVQWSQICLYGDKPCIHAITGPSGVFPYPDYETFIQGRCTNSLTLRCPFDMTEQAQGCSCGQSNYKVDLNNEVAGPVCANESATDPGAQWLTEEEYAFSVAMMHMATWARIVDLCGGDATLADTAWPHFYHFYNTPQGKAEVDGFLSSTQNLPPDLVTALKTNFTDRVQQFYGLLNGYRWSTAVINVWFTGAFPAPPQTVSSASAYTAFLPLLDPSHYNDITIDGQHYSGMEALKRLYFRETIEQTYANKSAHGTRFGNPFWDESQWQEAYRRAIGADKLNNPIGTAKDFFDEWAQAYIDAGLAAPGKSADNYFDPPEVPGLQNPYTDPNYDGNLPGLVPWEDAAPFVHRDTRDPTGHNYSNECGTDDIVAKILPYVAGAFGGVVTGMIIPGEMAKIGGFVAGGFACFQVIKANYGETADFWYQTENRVDRERDASLALSVGIPTLFFGGLYELNVLPDRLAANPVLFFGAVAGFSYYAIFPGFNHALQQGASILHVLLSPLDIAGTVLHGLFDGCDKHKSNLGIQCYCENANLKPLLTEAIVQDLWGTTGSQQVMRTQCMEAALTTGSWGTDPVNIGTCDLSNGWMNTPLACISAGEWAYGKWDPKLNQTDATQWQSEFLHCGDPYNPSMIPPMNGVDDACVKQYGEHARAGRPGYGVAGNCYDFRAPVGQQQLGVPTSYDWSKLNKGKPPGSSECSIL